MKFEKAGRDYDVYSEDIGEHMGFITTKYGEVEFVPHSHLLSLTVKEVEELLAFMNTLNVEVPK